MSGIPTQTDVVNHYHSFFSEEIERSDEILNKFQAADKFTITELNEIFLAARGFCHLLNIPKNLRGGVVAIAEQEGFQDEVERIRSLWETFGKKLPNQLSWFSFPQLTIEHPVQDLESFPFILSEAFISLLEIPSENKSQYQASWKGMNTCICHATTPKAIDQLAITIALNSKSLTLIDMGSGGCLPLFTVISHVCSSSNFDGLLLIHLIDPLYSQTAVNCYQVEPKRICPQNGKALIPQNPQDRGLKNLLFETAGLLPNGKVYFYVHKNVHTIEERYLRKDRHHVLMSIDPSQSKEFGDDFASIAKRIGETKDPSFYCLNLYHRKETALTLEEAMDPYPFFTKTMSTNEEEKN